MLPSFVSLKINPGFSYRCLKSLIGQLHGLVLLELSYRNGIEAEFVCEPEHINRNYIRSMFLLPSVSLLSKSSTYFLKYALPKFMERLRFPPSKVSTYFTKE